METAEFKRLIEKIASGEATGDELGLYNAYLNRLTKSETNWAEMQGGNDEDIRKELWHKIDAAINNTKKIYISIWRKVGIAASILIALSIGTYLLLNKNQNQLMVSSKKVQSNDIAPGSTKAYLTLANGQRIVLNNAPNGHLAIQGNTVINKTTSGQITYSNSQKNTNGLLTYNTISTPKGGTYMIVLSDGSKVWLNAVSSIKYPVEFVGNERKVEVTGEVYLEVAHNPAKPFKVIAAGQTVEVLGTHFNINAYPEEGMVRTTLLSGKIKISNATTSALINPGQQSQLVNNRINILNNVDISQVIAWKEGFFRIKNCDVQTVMRQMARWYDVDIVYEDKIPDVHFSGEIRRSVNASAMLHMLNYFNIHCEIKGRQILVSSVKNH